MADEPTPPAPTPPAPTPPTPTPPKPDDHEGRITELNNKLKEAKAKVKEYEDKQKQIEDDDAKKRGDHEKLLSERDTELAKLRGDHETASKTLEAYEKAAKEQIDAKLKGIKDEKKREALVKILGTRPVLEQFAVLEDAISLVGASGDFGAPTPPGGEVDKATKKKRYAELLGKRDQTPAERAEFRTLMTELSDFAQGDKGAFESPSK